MRYNDFTMLPEKAFQPLGGRMTLEGGGGSSPAPAPAAPTQTTVTNTNLPEYARPYVEDTLGKAQALTNINSNPYQSYQGERVAGFQPMQQQAFSNVQNMQAAPQNAQATNMSGVAGIGSLMAGQNYQNQATNPNAMQSYMSPYAQAAIDPTLRENQRNFDINQTQRNAQATGAGAFGGSRQAIVDSEALRNLGQQQANTEATGMQNAYQNAQNAMQFGTTANLQGYNQANQAAGTLLQAGQNQYSQNMGINAAQQQAGAQQQALQQQGLTNQYQDFLNQQNYPYKQLGFMSDLIHGTSLSGGTASSIYQAPPTAANQAIGLGLGAAGIGSLLKGAAKEGGTVRAYKKGGLVMGEGLAELGLYKVMGGEV